MSMSLGLHRNSKQWSAESVCVGEHIHLLGRWYILPYVAKREAPVSGTLPDLAPCACLSHYSFRVLCNILYAYWAGLVQSDSLQPYGLSPTGLFYPWNFPGKNPGVGCHLLLQAIFLSQGSNPSLLCLLHCQVHSLPLAPLGKPKYPL